MEDKKEQINVEQNNIINIKDLKKDPQVVALYNVTEIQLEMLGYTEHSTRHASIVSNWSKEILQKLNATERECYLVEIAGYLHDIGNAVSRYDHAQSGAMLAYNILLRYGMNYEDASEILLAIGNHDEREGSPVSRITAALILADKADVHRSRVRHSRRNIEAVRTDIHDRVNYAAVSSFLEVADKKIILNVTIDTDICPVMDYFEIYYDRMKMCRRAAELLDCRFSLVINGVKLL